MKVEDSSLFLPGFGLPEQHQEEVHSSPKSTHLPKVATISFFRNCKDEVSDFFAKRDKLTYPADRMQHFCVEGDSEDGTFQELQAEAEKRQSWIVRKRDFNCPQMRAFVHPGRLAKLSASANFSLRTLRRESDADYFLWIEMDLEYPPDIIERFLRWQKDIMAPMVMIKGTDKFYDTFAFRKGKDPNLKGPSGEPGCFQHRKPYHPAYREDEPFEVDCAGSCLFFSRKVLESKAYFTDQDSIAGFCLTAGEEGLQTWVDPTTKIDHPMPDHVLNWKEWEPWHETKVTMKYQEQVPIDREAQEMGKAYPFARQLDFAWISQRLIKETGTKTLEIGAKDSTFPAYCSLHGMEVVATDPENFHSEHQEWMKMGGSSYQFLQAQGRQLPFPDSRFEQIICMEALARDKADTKVALEISRVCQPGGRIFLSLPYDHVGFWWDNCSNMVPGRYYYNLQAVMDRIVQPMRAKIKDFSFIRFELPSRNLEPSFTHPNNSGVIVLELENGP